MSDTALASIKPPHLRKDLPLLGNDSRARARHRATPLYVGIAVFAIAIAIAGFWPKYFGPFMSGTLETPSIIHVHAAVFIGWLVIFGTQAWLAATGRVALHRKVGDYVLYWGLL